MILLNMMIGTMDLLIGTIALISVIIIEGIFLSKRLSKKWINLKIMITVMISNIISTFIGTIGFLTHGWLDILSFTKKILNLPNDYWSIFIEIEFFISAFILTLIIEIIINVAMLSPIYKAKNVLINTIYANIITYILLGLVIIILGLK